MLFRNPISLKKSDALPLSRRIAVVPVCPGAGASFVSSKLLWSAKGPKNLVELGKPHFYLSLNLQNRFTNEKFAFYEDVLSRQGLKDIRNQYADVNWILRKPFSSDIPDVKTLLRACQYPPEGLVFYDFSGVFNDDIFQVLSEMDEIKIVVDPLPSRLLESASYLEKLRLLYPESQLIVNKMNKGVFKKELNKFLETSDYTEISFVNPDLVYKAEYNCTIPQYFV